MINKIRRRLLEKLAGTHIIKDLDVDMEETIYPLTIHGTIEVKGEELETHIFEGTGIVNQDTSLTIATQGEIIAYYPAGTYLRAVTTL